MKASNIIFCNTLALLKKQRLLSASKLNRLAGAQLADAKKMLGEFSFCTIEQSDRIDIDAIINRAYSELFEFAGEYAPSKEAADFLLLRYAYANAKARRLEQAGGRLDERALYPFYASADQLDQERLNELEKELESPSAFRIDCVYTKAMYADLLAAAHRFSGRAKEIIKTEIDLKNILVFARVKKYNHSQLVFEQCLLDGGTIHSEVYTESFKLGILELLRDEHFIKYEFLLELFENDTDFADIELICDNYISNLSVAGDNELADEMTFVNYFYLKIAQIRIVKLILTAISGAISANDIKLRLKNFGGAANG